MPTETVRYVTLSMTLLLAALSRPSPVIAAESARAAAASSSSVNETAQAPPAQDARLGPMIRFYEGSEGTQDNFCNISIDLTHGDYSSGTTKMSDIGCSNDEARSMRMENLTPGTRIDIYDDPKCGTHDDYTEFTIESITPNTSILVWQFEQTGTWTRSNAADGKSFTYKSTYTDHGGLNGKVSCIDVFVPRRD